MHLLSSSRLLIYVPLSSFWQVQVSYTKSQFQRFRVVHRAVQILFQFYSVSLFVTSRISLKSSISSLSPCFLAPAFPLFLSFLLLRYCTPQTSPWTVSICFWFPPISFDVLTTTLCHLIPARPFVTFSHTAPSAMAGNLSFGVFLTLYCHINFFQYSICFRWVPAHFCSKYCTTRRT